MLLTVKQVKQETPEVFSLIFEKPKDFSFYAGQYLTYELPVLDPNGKSRPFTISASPTEDFLMLSTKYGLSPFKKALAQLKPGDSITSSHPAGTFILDESTPAVFIAGGIGITPFRSIIKCAVDNKLTTPITLFYSNADDNFSFKEELAYWKQSLPKLTIIYHNSSQNGHLTKLPTAPTGARYQLPIYYLAGPPKMVSSFEQMLIQHGVEKINIRYDKFTGYL